MRTRKHVISPNETLSDIADAYEMPVGWILSANPKRARMTLASGEETFSERLVPGATIDIPNPRAVYEMTKAYRDIFESPDLRDNAEVRDAAIGPEFPELPLGSMYLGPSQAGVTGPVYPAVAMQWWKVASEGARGGVLGDVGPFLPPVEDLPPGAKCDKGEYSDGSCVSASEGTTGVLEREDPSCTNGKAWDRASKTCSADLPEEKGEPFLSPTGGMIFAGVLAVSAGAAYLLLRKRP